MCPYEMPALTAGEVFCRIQIIQRGSDAAPFRDLFAYIVDIVTIARVYNKLASGAHADAWAKYPNSVPHVRLTFFSRISPGFPGES